MANKGHTQLKVLVKNIYAPELQKIQMYLDMRHCNGLRMWNMFVKKR